MSIKKFIKALKPHLTKKQLITEPMLCYAYGTDASIYRLIPQVVVLVRTEAEILLILRFATLYQVAITFRAAGTSLSGQAVTDQVLVVLEGGYWQNYQILNNGAQITLEPGMIAAHANLLLKPFFYKIGPDPASIDACKIGGIAANNSSGMCCGTKQNSYQTMAAMRLILANGMILDTSDQNSIMMFKKQNHYLLDELSKIREKIISSSDLTQIIKNKFKIKNTSGYSLNAFVDFIDPIEILAHLLIGSEGTLGFISNITYNTIKINPSRAVSLLYCDSLAEMVNLITALAQASSTYNLPIGASLQNDTELIAAMEILDITSLRSLDSSKYDFIPKLKDDSTALLIEITAANNDELYSKIKLVDEILAKYQVSLNHGFSRDYQKIAGFWELRKSIYPTVAAMRKNDESVVIEDIAVKIENLAAVTRKLRELFAKYNYENAAIFGHVLSGNLHFVFTPSLQLPEQIANYNGFMQELTTMIAIDYQGSLKAEHGCGRNIAPFVKLEWGEDLYQIMWQVKKLFDPNNILNRDVILTSNNNLHITDLKKQFAIDPAIDRCMECGFCEVVCPAKNLSLTPRQRISVFRYMDQLKYLGLKRLYAKFRKSFQYYGIKTCATTGLCAKKCPVGIDTGAFIQNLKPASWRFNKHIHFFIAIAKCWLYLMNLFQQLLGKKVLARITFNLNKLFTKLPVYLLTIPKVQGKKFINHISGTGKSIIYIPSCSTRIFEQANGNMVEKLLIKLGYDVIYPQNLKNLCCGQVISASGDLKLAQNKKDEILSLLEAGERPLIIDNSSCFATLVKNEVNKNILSVIDVIALYLDKLDLTPKYHKIALHFDCASQKCSDLEMVLRILQRCCHEVIIPDGIYCCGFAGSLGLTVPELNQSALASLKEQITDCDIGVTMNQNCQIGLSYHGGKKYLSLVDVVLQCLKC